MRDIWERLKTRPHLGAKVCAIKNCKSEGSGVSLVFFLP